MGCYEIPDAHKPVIADWLKDFIAISVRERNMTEQLSALTHRQVEWVSDPTLLHGSSFWGSFADTSCIPSGKYLLCYFLENRDWYFEYAKAAARYLNLELAVIPSCYSFSDRAEVLRQDVGPEAFVGLFKEASFVITDSFHGTIFSLIFQKSFLTLQRFGANVESGQNARLESLLGYVNLKNRIVPERSFAAEDLNVMTYDTVTEMIGSLAGRSREYLRKSFSGIQPCDRR